MKVCLPRLYWKIEDLCFMTSSPSNVPLELDNLGEKTFKCLKSHFPFPTRTASWDLVTLVRIDKYPLVMREEKWFLKPPLTERILQSSSRIQVVFSQGILAITCSLVVDMLISDHIQISEIVFKIQNYSLENSSSTADAWRDDVHQQENWAAEFRLSSVLKLTTYFFGKIETRNIHCE